MANLPPAKKRASSGSASEELKSAESGARALGASTAEGADINPASAKNQEAAEESVPGKSSSEVATRVVTPAPAREEAKTKEAGSNASVNSRRRSQGRTSKWPLHQRCKRWCVRRRTRSIVSSTPARPALRDSCRLFL